MARAWVQFVVGVGLGFLSIPSMKNPDGDGEFLQLSLVVAGAAATTIAPRFWWMGIVALWLGQGLWHAAATDGSRPVVHDLATSIAATGTPFLIGAVLGGAAWSVVARRHQRGCKIADEASSLQDSA